ncbi:MAG: helix-turn-helix domain-containing protein [Rhodospirillaceae bacterium]
MSEIEKIKVTIFPDGRLDSCNAALYLGLSPKTLAMMRSAGNGPKFVKRGRIFYFLEDLQAWMEDQPRVRSTGEARALSEMKRPANDR